MQYIANCDLTPDAVFRAKHCGSGFGGVPNIVRKGRRYELSEEEYKKYPKFFDPVKAVTKEAKK